MMGDTSVLIITKLKVNFGRNWICFRIWNYTLFRTAHSFLGRCYNPSPYFIIRCTKEWGNLLIMMGVSIPV